jgi:trans-aconitate methyltransferase
VSERVYHELAGWFHLLTAPADYAEEAAEIVGLVEVDVPGARTLLELGCGGGNNASHLKRRFSCTLADLSDEMLAVSRGLNPECEHVHGDMRSLRLGRTFDAVLIHDAVTYMTTEHDLRAALATAFAHTRPGGVAIVIPDCVRETFAEETRHGGHDGGGRSLRYLEWTHDPDPTDTTYDVDFAILLREGGGAVRVVHDHHVNGVFAEREWLEWLGETGFEARVERLDVEDAGDWRAFVARRPAVASGA